MKYYEFLDNEEENAIKRIIENETSEVLHGILVFNIDNFIIVNEMFGRSTGNQILKQVQDKMQRLFRGSDIIVKLRGDEFIVFSKNIRELSNIELLANKVLKKISSICVNDSFNLTASVGLAIYPFHGSEYKELKNKAYQAMYRAKANGKNSYRLYDSARTKAMYHEYMYNRAQFNKSNHENYFEFGENKSFFDLCTSFFREDRDAISAVNSILEINCIYFGFSRGYVYTKADISEEDKRKLYYANSGFEFGKESEIFKTLKEDMICRLAEKYSGFTLINANDESVEDEVRLFLEDQNITQILFYPVINGENPVAYFILENLSDELVEFTMDELAVKDDEFKSIQTYFYHSYDKSNSKEHLAKLEMFENIDACVYLIDSSSYTIEYANRKAVLTDSVNRVGSKCFETFCNAGTPCEECPLRNMNPDEAHANASNESYNFATRNWAKNLFSWMDPVENKGKALMISVDVDKYFAELKD